MGDQNLDAPGGLFSGLQRFLYKKDDAAFRTFKSRTAWSKFFVGDFKFCLAFRTYYNQCLVLLGNQSFMLTNPMRNPPMWANHATPPPSRSPALVTPFKICIIAQNPITIKAGILTVVIKNPKKIKVYTVALGKRSKYAPRMPEIAPLAPIIGIVECGSAVAFAYAAITPQNA